MLKALLIGIVVVASGILVASLPVFAHSAEDGEGAPSDQEWAAMHEACEIGDWDAMAETAEETHGEDFEDMPCHDDTDHADQGETLGDDNYSGATWGHMGEGMMDGGHVMSMGW